MANSSIPMICRNFCFILFTALILGGTEAQVTQETTDKGSTDIKPGGSNPSLGNNNLGNRGAIYFSEAGKVFAIGNYKQALEGFKQATEAYLKAEDHLLTARCYEHQGYCYNHLGNPEAAVKAGRESLIYSRKTENPLAIAYSHPNMVFST